MADAVRSKSRPLVAREAPLGTLRRALAEAAEGHGSVALVRGEPGIGKSAVAEVVAREAEASGARVVTGRAWELAEAPPLFPVWTCLHELGIATRPTASGTEDVYRLWEEVLSGLARVSAKRPMVWVLEDIHAADLQTLDLLAFLAQPIRSLRMLVVSTARKQDPRITERANQRLVRIARAGVDLELPSLDAEAVAAVAESVLGRPLSRAAVAELVELTGGNPLFVVECARAFRAAGAAPRSVVTLPPTIRQVVGERVALLPETTRRVLAGAAVLGRESSAATVARMSRTLPANVIDAMRPALDAGIVSEPQPGRFAFTHILVRDAIEDALAPSERAALHASAETALDDAGESPDVLVERARHALASMRADGIELGLHAARLLEELGAFDRALAMYERVEQARSGVIGRAASIAERLHVARVAQQAGRHAEAREICEEALTRARAQGDAELMAKAALTLGAELRPGTVDRALVAALEEARSALTRSGAELGSTALGCRVLARLAAALQPAQDFSTPVALAKDAIVGARLLGDDATILDVLHLAVAALVDYVPIAERRPVVEELLQRALSAQDWAKAVRAQVLLAIDQAEAGDFDQFELSGERALDLSYRLGHPRHRWRALLLGSMRALVRGDVAASDRRIVEAQQLSAVTDDPALMLSLLAHATQVARLLHRDDDMRRIDEQLDEKVVGVPQPRFVAAALRAGLAATLEDPGRAAAALAVTKGAPLPPEPDLFSALTAEAYALVRDEAGCRRMHAHFAQHEDRHVVSGSIPMTYEGPVGRVLALLESALGQHDSAVARLRRAVAQADERGHRAWVAQLRYDLARALERRGREQGGGDDDARSNLAAAATMADEIGMPGLAARARLASSAGARSEASESAPLRRPDVRVTMTREGDTWRLEHAGRIVRVKDSRGMQILARLVERPGEEIHVLVLASDEPSSSLQDGGSDDILDARARREYKQRLADLEVQIAEAERDGDIGRLERLRREEEALESELKRALGLGGRSRGTTSASERARVNVQRRIKDAIARVAEHDAALGRFLEKAVRTGTYCRFFV